MSLTKKFAASDTWWRAGITLSAPYLLLMSFFLGIFSHPGWARADVDSIVELAMPAIVTSYPEERTLGLIARPITLVCLAEHGVDDDLLAAARHALGVFQISGTSTIAKSAQECPSFFNATDQELFTRYSVMILHPLGAPPNAPNRSRVFSDVQFEVGLENRCLMGLARGLDGLIHGAEVNPIGYRGKHDNKMIERCILQALFFMHGLTGAALREAAAFDEPDAFFSALNVLEKARAKGVITPGMSRVALRDALLREMINK